MDPYVAYTFICRVVIVSCPHFLIILILKPKGEIVCYSLCAVRRSLSSYHFLAVFVVICYVDICSVLLRNMSGIMLLMQNFSFTRLMDLYQLCSLYYVVISFGGLIRSSMFSFHCRLDNSNILLLRRQNKEINFLKDLTQ